MSKKVTVKRKLNLSIFVFLLIMTFSLIQPVHVQAASSSENYKEWMDVCHTMLVNFKKYHFKYGSSVKSTYESAVKKRRKADCAHYVSWCLQKYGILDRGETFYVKSSGSIRKRGFGFWGSKVKVIRMNKRCSSAKLEPGDVVCWKNPGHVNIYVGRSSSGKRLWYDGGKVSTKSNRSGSRYTKTSARSLGYLNKRKISYVIRIKNV